ncbi:MAG: AAA family ATPase [Candidatus Babeliaceae bacterium]|nr:AAA family ATPase [Candidatus Babeliaceae bacterium]
MNISKKLMLFAFLCAQTHLLSFLFPDAVEFRLSPNFATQVMDAISQGGDTFNKTMDGFFQQLNVSLPKAHEGIVSFGKSIGSAITPAAHVIVSSSGAITGIVAAGVISTYIAHKYTTRYMFEPSLIEKSSKNSFLSYLNRYYYRTSAPVNICEHMVINQDLKNKLEYVIQMTKNIKLHGGQFDNVLLYGAPGTGKTLFAELLAQHCGMDYAIIPAANISQFLTKGTVVEELNNLFDWAAKSDRGTILFLDEAEVFLADRKTLDNIAQNALSSFLSKTGTPSNKIMIICTTNRPEILDPAVISRLGIHIEFKLPDLDARVAQIKMHTSKIFAQQTGTVVDFEYLKDEQNILALAKRLDGFSGRMIQKCINSFRQCALAQNILKIDASIVEQVIQQLHENINN